MQSEAEEYDRRDHSHLRVSTCQIENNLGAVPERKVKPKWECRGQ
jgi:hypothetical protein